LGGPWGRERAADTLSRFAQSAVQSSGILIGTFAARSRWSAGLDRTAVGTGVSGKTCAV